jgi:type II secretory pathway pseudopilin PulG
LLVVIAIIGLLVSIIVPSIRRARELREAEQQQTETKQQSIQRKFIIVQEKMERHDQFFVVDEERETWLCEGSDEATDLQLYNSFVVDQKYFVAYYKLPDDTMRRIVKASKEE